tara:strand:+ start:2771 stop:3700 length:930 start_codon:yes stop_codon:yes gene_type:complete
MNVAIVCNGRLGSAIRGVITRQKNRFTQDFNITWFDDTNVGQTMSEGALHFSNYSPEQIAKNHRFIIAHTDYKNTHALANNLPEDHILITINRTDMFHGTGQNIVDGVGLFSGFMDLVSNQMTSEYSNVEKIDYYVGMNPNIWDGKTPVAPNIDEAVYSDIVNSGNEQFGEISLRTRNYISEGINHSLYLPYHRYDYSLNWLYLNKNYRNIVRNTKKFYNNPDSYLDLFTNVKGVKNGQPTTDIYYIRIPATQGASAWHYAEACCAGSWLYMFMENQIERKEWHPKDADWRTYTNNIFGKRFEAAPIAA